MNQQLENKISKIERSHKQHKQFFTIIKWLFGFLIAINLLFFIRESNILNLLVAVLFGTLLSMQYIILKQEKSLISNLYEWLTNKKVIERKDITIHNLIEMFFSLKEDIRINILNRDEIYDRVVESTQLINTGDITKEDCLKEPVDKNS